MSFLPLGSVRATSREKSSRSSEATTAPEHRQELITIGTSAGGVEALRTLVSGLPADLQAAVCLVLHIGRGMEGGSYLPEILGQAGPLPATHARNGEAIKKGHIYIAPADHHLLVHAGWLRVVRGPKENFSRPAIDPLFRSAAAAYGPRVTGVILTGMLDDGVAGLAETRRRGGLAVVQDPATALFPEMPRNAIRFAGADYILKLDEMAEFLARLAVTDRDAVTREEPMDERKIDVTCPECRGPLWEERQGDIVYYRCRVGHRYSPLHMAQEHEETVERALWASVVALEEAADIAAGLGPPDSPHAEDARRKRAKANAIRALLEKPEESD